MDKKMVQEWQAGWKVVNKFEEIERQFKAKMVERSIVDEVSSQPIRIPTPEDLIIMKAIAHRPKDMTDIEAVITSHPKLDQKRIQFWVEQFAEVLETPELWTDVARLLRRAK